MNEKEHNFGVIDMSALSTSNPAIDPEGVIAAKDFDRDALETVLAETCLEKSDHYVSTAAKIPECEAVDTRPPTSGGCGPMFKSRFVGPDEVCKLVEALDYNDDVWKPVITPGAYDDPRMHDNTYRESMAHMSGRAQLLHKQIRDDLDISKALVEELHDQEFLKNQQIALSQMLLARAGTREIDRGLHFVIVKKDMDPRTLVKTVQVLEGRYPWVEPVDLEPGFEGVEPIPQETAEELTQA